MNELLELLEEPTNFKRISYDIEKGLWLIEYKTNLSPDEVESDNLIEFLQNV